MADQYNKDFDQSIALGDEMQTLDQFISALRTLPSRELADHAREQANTLVKQGNPYFAAMLRELANRTEGVR